MKRLGKIDGKGEDFGEIKLIIFEFSELFQIKLVYIVVSWVEEIAKDDGFIDVQVKIAKILRFFFENYLIELFSRHYR